MGCIYPHCQAAASTLLQRLQGSKPSVARSHAPNLPVQRYEWDISFDLIDIDIRYLASFRKVVSRITGDRQRGVLRNCVTGRSIVLVMIPRGWLCRVTRGSAAAAGDRLFAVVSLGSTASGSSGGG